MTNSYDVGSDYEGASPIIGRDESSNEFNISVRTDGRGKFKAMKFSSKYRASILTELQRIRGNRIAAVGEFPVLHLRRRTLEWIPLVSFMTGFFSWACFANWQCFLSVVRYLSGSFRVSLDYL